MWGAGRHAAQRCCPLLVTQIAVSRLVAELREAIVCYRGQYSTVGTWYRATSTLQKVPVRSMLELCLRRVFTLCLTSAVVLGRAYCIHFYYDFVFARYMILTNKIKEFRNIVQLQ